jgi:Flp pilus assembly protein protease CpaA
VNIAPAVLADAVLLATVLVAAVTDLLERRIYNILTMPVILAGLFSPALTGLEWWRGVAGMAALGAPFFLLYAISPALMGPGDVKLLMAAGAWLGLTVDSLEVGLGSILIGGLLALFTLVATARLLDVVRVLRPGASPEKSVKAPFGLAIAIATVLVVTVRDIR